MALVVSAAAPSHRFDTFLVTFFAGPVPGTNSLGAVVVVLVFFYVLL